MSSVCYLLLYLSLTLAAFSSEITQQAKRSLRDDLKLPADALAGAVILVALRSVWIDSGWLLMQACTKCH